MKKTIKIKCPAKVNLSLDVLRRRKDGYHDLEMIMHTVKLFDILSISFTPASEEEIVISTSSGIIPSNEHNICFKIAKAFLKEANLSAKVNIHIKKNIPVGAGLGGGSSDAAGTLLALNKLSGNPLSVPTLLEIAKEIGADVPFFLYGGCMLAEGIGEKLSPLPTLKDAVILIAKPPYGISTPSVYKKLNLENVSSHPDTKKAIEALKTGDLNQLGKASGNVLETAVTDEHPEIEEYKSIMTKNGAIYSLMSGSGSSVFGVFDNPSLAEAASIELKALTNQVFLA